MRGPTTDRTWTTLLHASSAFFPCLSSTTEWASVQRPYTSTSWREYTCCVSLPAAATLLVSGSIIGAWTYRAFAHSGRISQRSSLAPADDLYRLLHCLHAVRLVRPSGTMLCPTRALESLYSISDADRCICKCICKCACTYTFASAYAPAHTYT